MSFEKSSFERSTSSFDNEDEEQEVFDGKMSRLRAIDSNGNAGPLKGGKGKI
jgi:hypothetical protein